MTWLIKFGLFLVGFWLLLPGIRFEVYYVLDNNPTNAMLGALLVGLGLGFILTGWEAKDLD